VAHLGRYFPASMGRRRPRDPVLKWNSNYKADEKLGYIYAIGPMEFRPPMLPMRYYLHFCKLCRCVEIDAKDEITQDELQELSKLAVEWCYSFEILYVQRKAHRLHFVRPWIHTMLHIASEIARMGPTSYYSQWTMERMIGMLKEQLRLHSDPYTNLAMAGTRMCQLNILTSALYDSDMEGIKITSRDRDLGDNFALLHPRQREAREVAAPEAAAIRQFMDTHFQEGHRWGDGFRIVRWGRLALPNGDAARSAWKECLKPEEKVARARMVQVCCTATCDERLLTSTYTADLRGGDALCGGALLLPPSNRGQSARTSGGHQAVQPARSGVVRANLQAISILLGGERQ
jgi:hypothetical protein